MNLDLVVGMSVGEKQVEVAVVIVIKELGTPTAQEPRRAADAERASHVVKCEIVIVVIDGIHFLVDIRHKKVLPAILIIVRRIDPHARSRTSVLAISDTGVKADFFELPFAIEKNKIREGVIGHEK